MNTPRKRSRRDLAACAAIAVHGTGLVSVLTPPGRSHLCIVACRVDAPQDGPPQVLTVRATPGAWRAALQAALVQRPRPNCLVEND